MRALLNLFLDICLFRKGPQDVPASSVLLKLCLSAYSVSGLVLSLVAGVEPMPALYLLLLDLALLIGLTYAVMAILGWQQRLLQTLTALTGTGFLLQVLVLPVLIWLHQAAANNGLTEVPTLLYLLFLGWSTAVTGHILRHALSVHWVIGTLGAVGYLFIFQMISGWLVPGG